jgi:membrane-associated protease RseP (regulator of RpoE activity)
LTVEHAESEKTDEKQRRIEFNFPILTMRTQLFQGIFDKLGRFRFSRWLSWLALAIVPAVAGIGLYLLVSSLVGLFWNPAAASAARQVGLQGYLLLPGINPYLPILYGWFAIVVAIAIHEGAHGVAARSLGLRVKSSGLLFFLFIPIGAFVDVDEEELKRASGRASSRVLSAGVGANIAVASACLIGVLLIVGGLTPAINGVYVGAVTDGLGAQKAGILSGDVLITVDNARINSTQDLGNLLGNLTSGDIVEVTVARGDMWQTRFSTLVNLTTSENRTIMGVSVGNLLTHERLQNYRDVTLQTLPIYLVPPALAPGLVPFSDSLAPFYKSSLGAQWTIYVNTLYWVWFVNVNVAVFNALPLYPMDGGRIFNVLLKRLIRSNNPEKVITAITAAVSVALVLVLVLIIVLPFIL